MLAKKIYVLLLFGLLAYNAVAVVKSKSTNKPSVNILTWYGYLDDPKIKQIVENKCNVKFSFDSYNTNEEFVHDIKEKRKDYDIAIFSNLAYNSVIEEIKNPKSDLWKLSENYYPYFKNYYNIHKYPHNVAFFTHSIVGFIFNPKVININSNENIFEIFKNAKKNDVVLIDDPAEVGTLLSIGYKNGKNKYKSSIQGTTANVIYDYDNLENVTQKANVYITNDYNRIYEQKNFAFGLLWSGDALLYAKQSKLPYKFALNPSLSFICTDLIAQLNPTPSAKCVADTLGSSEIMKYIEKSTYYFTPYFTNDIHESGFDELYTQTKSLLPELPWVQPVPDFLQMMEPWNAVKIKVNNK